MFLRRAIFGCTCYKEDQRKFLGKFRHEFLMTFFSKFSIYYRIFDRFRSSHPYYVRGSSMDERPSQGYTVVRVEDCTRRLTPEEHRNVR